VCTHPCKKDGFLNMFEKNWIDDIKTKTQRSSAHTNTTGNKMQKKKQDKKWCTIALF